MYTNDVNAYRDTFANAWKKFKNKETLDAIEIQLVDVILLHPHYHSLLAHPKYYHNQAFDPDENPFLHMSLHLSVQEQIRMDKPAGITSVYTQLLQKYLDPHETLHKMMSCLGQVMREIQQDGHPPCEATYLEKLRQL